MIERLFNKAYLHKSMRKHEKLFIAIDMHGTVFKEFDNDTGGYRVYPKAIDGLKELNKHGDIVLIGFTSSTDSAMSRMGYIFDNKSVHFTYFNQNPECKNTGTGDFSKKFYYDILLDDRAGFDPLVHWNEIINYYTKE